MKLLLFDLLKIEKALKRNGCFAPGLCAQRPYSCGCGYLVKAKYDTLECISRLAHGLPIGSEKS